MVIYSYILSGNTTMDNESLQKFIGKIKYDKERYPSVYEYIIYNVRVYITQKFGKAFDAEHIEDFVFDVFAKLKDPEIPVNVDRVRSPMSYIYAMAKNHVLDYIHKYERIDFTDNIDELAYAVSDIDAHLFKSDVKQLLGLVDELSAKLVYLHEYYKFKCTELARMFHITPVNVRVKIHRALKFLNEYCNKHNIDFVL